MSFEWTANSTQSQRGRRLLDKLGDEAGDWLTMSLDPYHDYSYNVAGLPDDRCQASVVRCQTSLHDITKPTTVTTGLWDCYILTLPFGGTVLAQNQSVNMYSSGGHHISYIAGGGSLSGNFSTITVIRVPAGEAWYGPAASADTYDNNIAINCFDGISDYIPARFIGGGFEVHNVTPELYKGGTFVHFDNGCDHDIVTAVASGDNGTTYGSVNTKVYRGPPPTSVIAAKHPSSKTWAASEGCYVRIPLVLDSMEYKQSLCGQGFLLTPPSGTNSLAFLTYAPNQGVAGTQHWRPIGSGIVLSAFTGLSPETVLTLNTRLFVETAPTINSAELALSSPAAPFDPQVLELYRNTSCMLPGAVPVGMNPKGEFWGMVVKTLGQAGEMLTPLVASIPVYGQAAAPLMSVASTALKSKGSKMVEQAKAKAAKPAVKPSPSAKKK